MPTILSAIEIFCELSTEDKCKVCRRPLLVWKLFLDRTLKKQRVVEVKATEEAMEEAATDELAVEGDMPPFLLLLCTICSLYFTYDLFAISLQIHLIPLAN